MAKLDIIQQMGILMKFKFRAARKSTYVTI